MKNLNQVTNFENFTEFTLTDIEMTFVRGGDGDDDKGTVIIPITDPEI